MLGHDGCTRARQRRPGYADGEGKRGRAESAGLLTNVLDTDEPGEGRRRWRGSRAHARGRDDVLAPNPWLRLRVMQGRRARRGGSTPVLR
jgi:hypothetical protein